MYRCSCYRQACVKDDLHNTPHPDKGAVKVTTDWTGRSSDAILPDSYVLRTGGNEQTVSGETNAVNTLFDPGQQELLVYHRTEGITIDGNIATVNTRADGTLEPMRASCSRLQKNWILWRTIPSG